MEDLLEFYNELMDEHIPSGNNGLNLIERRILLEVLNSTEDTENCRKLIINVLQRMRNKIGKYICRMTCNDWLRYSLISGKGEFLFLNKYLLIIICILTASITQLLIY